MAARMSSADLVQRKGLGAAFCASMQARMSFSSAWVVRWTPRRICLSVITSNANDPGRTLRGKVEIMASKTSGPL